MFPADRVQLHDGRTAAIRTADASDAAALRRFFASLSASALRQRFHFGFRELPDYLLGKLTAIADGASTIILAESSEHGTSSERQVVGEARYVRMNDSPDIAEVAIVVTDSWQRVGLGGNLVSRLLAHARYAGVQAIVAYVSRENEAVVQLLRAFGARSVPGTAYSGDVQMRIDLDPLRTPASQLGRPALPDSTAGR